MNQSRNKKLDLGIFFPNKQTEQEILSERSNVEFKKTDKFKPQQKKLFNSDWENRLYFGDNLNVLRKLVETGMKGKVRLVYIDPPFAKDREFKINEDHSAVKQFSRKGKEAYKDKILGGQYLSFLQKRLVLLKELLAEDGSIYLHIDSAMGHYVKVLMDEIFGRERFINDIARIKCNPKNFKRAAYGNIKDMILFYSKGKDYIWNDPREEYSEEEIKRLFPKTDEDGRRYTTYPLHAPGETENGPTGQTWKGMEPPEGRHWRAKPEELTELDEQGLIEWSRTGNPRKKKYAEEKKKEGKKRQDVWEFKDPAYPDYPTQKNLDMLKTIVEASSNEGDLVLDCFAGSGTTLIAAEELDRRWIGIDNSKSAIDTCIERITSRSHRTFSLFTKG